MTKYVVKCSLCDHVIDNYEQLLDSMMEKHEMWHSPIYRGKRNGVFGKVVWTQ